MPILDLPSDDAPLTQGDVLKGLPLYATGANWGQSANAESLVKSPLCLVISRPCALANKDKFIVAEIERNVEDAPRDTKTFGDVRGFLDTLRDGLGTPDRFYLGQMPNYSQSGRFFARLDSLHTVKLPDRDRLPTLLRDHRIATLNPDFRRDLHRRIFSAFAALGFNDLNWYSDEDLRWLVHAGQGDAANLSSAVQKIKSEISQNVASGHSDRNQKLEKDVNKAENELQMIVANLAPYEAELARRGIPSR
jgi:hypothetical protein